MRVVWRMVRGLILLGVALLPPDLARASANLPLHHWAYEAIERLHAMGLIDHAMTVTKPYSRKEAARYVAQLIERVRTDRIKNDGREEVGERLLARLRREFRPELEALGVYDRREGRPPHGIRYGARVQTEADAFFVGGGQTVRFRENRGGEYYVNGEQNQTDVRGWLEVGDWAAIALQPKFISNRHILGIGATNNSLNFYLREGNVKLTQWNVALEVGRGSQWWGPGYRGSLLLTDHAYPLDMIKLGSEEPFRLPWMLASLGEWKVQTFLTRLEVNRDFPRTKVFGLRIGYMPAGWLELGLARLTQFNGRGHSGSFPGTVFDAYFDGRTYTDNKQANEQAMLDFRARIPRSALFLPFPAGMQLYGELGVEDPIKGLGMVLGLYIPQLAEGSTTDLRLEVGYTDWRRQFEGDSAQWYNNSEWNSGMRYKGFPLGHWVGTDGLDLFLRSTHYATETIQVGANLEYSSRQRGLPVHETKYEIATDVSWWVTGRVHWTAGYTQQWLKNPGQITSITPFVETFASGVTARNSFLWTSLAVEF